VKEIYEHISQNNANSYIYRYFCLPQFNGSYHYHSELELTYIESSSGKRFVGSNVSDYQEGDLVLIGSNIPHCWKSAKPAQSDKGYAKAKVIQFSNDFFDTQISRIPELIFLKNLHQKAGSGLLIKGNTRAEIVKKMNFENAENSFQNFLTLLEILYLISQSKESEYINNQISGIDFTHKETERFNSVFSYIVENYTTDINLNILADLAHLTPTSFCRYFKQVAKKTPFDVIVELRIKHACNLLKSTEMSIADICFESGFGNLSHFNKEFKKSTNLTPLKYRRMF